MFFTSPTASVAAELAATSLFQTQTSNASHRATRTLANTLRPSTTASKVFKMQKLMIDVFVGMFYIRRTDSYAVTTKSSLVQCKNVRGVCVC